MDGFATNGPLRFFRDLPDPRARNVRHRLIDILVLSLCAVLCDADSWEDFEVFVRVKRPWFQTFLDFKHGVPSADTFRRVFSRLDPAGLERCFLNWMKSVVELSGGQLLAIDGKSICRSFEHAWDKSGMAHMVSLFVHANGQVFTAGRSRASCTFWAWPISRARLSPSTRWAARSQSPRRSSTAAGTM